MPDLWTEPFVPGVESCSHFPGAVDELSDAAIAAGDYRFQKTDFRLGEVEGDVPQSRFLELVLEQALAALCLSERDLPVPLKRGERLGYEIGQCAGKLNAPPALLRA